MNPADFPDIPPRPRRFKRLVNHIVFFVLGRGLQSLSRHDRLIQQECSNWPEDFTLMVVVRANGGTMAVQRAGSGRLVYKGSQFPESSANVVIYLKNIDTAFAILTGQMGIDTGYAHHSMCARGDLSHLTSVVRVINVAETYLFPSFMARRLMKRLPPLPYPQKQMLRLKTYLLGIPFGV